MKNQLPTIGNVIRYQNIKSNSIIRKINVAFASILLCSCIGVLQAHAQFSKPVVMLKGTVRAEESGKPYPVKISIRSGDNKAVEITSSQSNSISGNFLVVLQPKKKYWIVLECPGAITKDELIETPDVRDNTVQMKKDFTVTTTSIKDISEESSKNSSDRFKD